MSTTEEVKIETFEEVAKKAGEQLAKDGEELTKRILSKEFDYCIAYIALADSEGKCKLNIELTLRDVKILETGLDAYKSSLQKELDKKTEIVTTNRNGKEIKLRRKRHEDLDADYKHEQKECDKILAKLKKAQIPVFKDLTEEDIFYMYAHKILGPGTWTGGGTVQ